MLVKNFKGALQPKFEELEAEGVTKLNKMDIFYIKGLLHTERQIKQAQLEELQKAKAKTPENIYITNILHIQSELEQIDKIINKL